MTTQTMTTVVCVVISTTNNKEYKMLPYQAVSMGAILRDYIKPDYANDIQRHLVDIADFVYNNGMTPKSNPELFAPHVKRLYAEYGDEFWDLVRRDMRALDSQLDYGADNKIRGLDDLIADYNDLLKELA